MSITVVAASCPAPVVPPTIWAADYAVSPATPPTSQGQSPGVVVGPVTSKMNGNAAKSDIESRASGWGVLNGLTPSIGTGLKVTFTAGQAMLDGLVEQTASFDVIVNNNITRGWIWMDQTGATHVVDNSITAPVGHYILLATYVSSSGSVTSVETAGVVTLVGSGLWRTTADNGAPGDTPDSSLRLHTVTKGGVYFWDGSRHLRVGASGRQQVNVASADQTLTLTQMMAQVIEAAGSPGSAKNIIWPQAVDGAAYDVYNSTGQTVTFLVTGQTGVAVAAGKAARIYCHATDIRRLTADVTP